MGMILRIASSRIVGQGDIVGRSGYFSLNLSANSVMRGRLDARRTLKSLVADLRIMKRNIIRTSVFGACLWLCCSSLSAQTNRLPSAEGKELKIPYAEMALTAELLGLLSMNRNGMYGAFHL